MMPPDPYPPTKRRRVSNRPNPTIVIVAPGEYSPKMADGQETFTRHVDFWLDDGNLILLAGDTAFCVYKGLLTKNSAVFEDMFASGSADVTETFDGCPVVRLPDHPKDFRDFLQYLMPCSKLTLRDGLPVSDFAKLHAAVHLAHKYQCPDVEMRALSILKKFYTPRFTCDPESFYPPEGFATRPPKSAAIAAVNIARLTGTPSMLPFALYEVCTLEERILDGYRRRDGSVEHLAPTDLRLCLSARRELSKQMVFYIQDIFRTLGPSPQCKRTAECTEALNGICHEVQLVALGGCDVFDIHEWKVKTLARSFSLCPECTKSVREQEEAERLRVWEMLPDVFGMKNKECGFTDRYWSLEY